MERATGMMIVHLHVVAEPESKPKPRKFYILFFYGNFYSWCSAKKISGVMSFVRQFWSSVEENSYLFINLLLQWDTFLHKIV